MYKLPAISPERLEFAAEIFLAEARKTELKLNPMSMPRAKKIADYSDIHRAVLMSSIKKALLSAGTDYDAVFAAWQQKKSENVD